MEVQSLTVQYRRETGKGPIRRLRREGMIPGVLYGKDQDPLPFSLAGAELSRILGQGAAGSPLFDIKVEGDETKECRSLVRDMQIHPVTGKLLHIDLQVIHMDKEITLNVPVVLQGEAPGVKVEGGIMEQNLRQLSVACLPDNIPDAIVVDVSGLSLNETIHLEEVVSAYPGVKFLDDPVRTLATVVAPAKLAAETAQPAEEAAEAEAAEAGEGAEDKEAGKAEESSGEGGES